MYERKQLRKRDYTMRIWGKLWKDNHMIQDTVIELYDINKTRTTKVYESLEQICDQFDLQKPIWLDVNKQDFIRSARCRFYQDSFIETIPFDYLELHVIEEDCW